MYVIKTFTRIIIMFLAVSEKRSVIFIIFTLTLKMLEKNKQQQKNKNKKKLTLITCFRCLQNWSYNATTNNNS